MPKHPLTVLALGVAALAIIGSFIYAKGDVRGDDVVITRTTIPNNPVVLSEADTDQDGLKDWEEVLWKTDPKNPDTDGDATLDGEEVKNGRDPRIPGPDDALPAGSAGISHAPTEQNETDALARTLAAEYLKNPDGVDPEELARALAEDVEANAPIAVREHTLAELVVANISPREYGNTAGNVFTENLESIEHELSILYKALVVGETGYIKNLFKTQAAYRKLVRGLLVVNTPEDIAPIHLALINALEAIAIDLEKLTKIETDPITGLAALNSYSAHSDNLDTAFSAIAVYLNEHATFEENEGGYVFTQTLNR